jgi:hypothetical protein
MSLSERVARDDLVENSGRAKARARLTGAKHQPAISNVSAGDQLRTARSGSRCFEMKKDQAKILM